MDGFIWDGLLDKKSCDFFYKCKCSTSMWFLCDLCCCATYSYCAIYFNYFGLEKQFQQAGLPIFNSEWSNIHDFHAKDGSVYRNILYIGLLLFLLLSTFSK